MFSSMVYFACYTVPMRTLGIDFGTKRIGLALSDEAGIAAYPFSIIQNSAQAVTDIQQVCKDKEVAIIVMGKSVDSAGANNSVADAAIVFADSITKATGLPVQFINEGFSSFEAARSARIEKPIANPHRHEHDTSAHDDRAAAIILQRYLDTQ